MQIIKESRGSNAIGKMLRGRDLADFKSAYVSLATLLKRLRPIGQNLPFNTPPGQTTVPQNPDFSGGSTGTNSSVESKPEIYAQNVALKFLEATCSTIDRWLEGIEWINPATKAYLLPQYVHGSSMILTLVVAKICQFVLDFKLLEPLTTVACQCIFNIVHCQVKSHAVSYYQSK
jgi:hypothetical protein